MKSDSRHSATSCRVHPPTKFHFAIHLKYGDVEILDIPEFVRNHAQLNLFLTERQSDFSAIIELMQFVPVSHIAMDGH